jgi:hypothetical protein
MSDRTAFSGIFNLSYVKRMKRSRSRVRLQDSIKELEEGLSR